MEYKTYEKGILNGFYQRFSPDSLLIKEGNYSNGEKDGLWNLYYRSGILKEQLEYTQFNLVGSMRNSWNPEGQQMIKDGIGIEYFYNVDGELLAGMRIKHGKRRTKILKWKPPN
jgi:antitoxin component YwqK of YwqJK toxin-antitoxin module